MAKEVQVIGKDDVGSLGDIINAPATVSENGKRQVTSQFVSDGIYKQVYLDTGEDVK